MADKKITDPTIPLATNIADNDVTHVVDVSDTTDDPAGTSKRTLFSLVKTTIKDWILGLNNTFTDTNTFQTLGLNPIAGLGSLSDKGAFYYRGLRKFTLSTFESLALKAATFDLSSLTNEKVYTLQDKDGTIAHLDDITDFNFQLYESPVWLDASSVNNWIGVHAKAASSTSNGFEYYLDTNVLATSNITTILEADLLLARPLGVAFGTQIVDSFELWTNQTLISNVQGISIVKANWTLGTLNSITTLYSSNSLSITNGVLSLTDVDFSETSISNGDVIYLFFSTISSDDITPIHIRLKTILT